VIVLVVVINNLRRRAGERCAVRLNVKLCIL
jgi:hypothetical protein